MDQTRWQECLRRAAGEIGGALEVAQKIGIGEHYGAQVLSRSLAVDQIERDMFGVSANILRMNGTYNQAVAQVATNIYNQAVDVHNRVARYYNQDASGT